MTRINSIVRAIIIEQYIQGFTLDEIAKYNGISKGSVFNCVREFRYQIGGNNIDEIRYFTTILKKSCITIQDCIEGSRLSQVLKRFNIYDDFEKNELFESGLFNFNSEPKERTSKHTKTSENSVERDQIETGLTEINGIVEFLNDFYRPCKILGMEPSNIVSWIQDLLKNVLNENKALEDFEEGTYRISTNRPRIGPVPLISKISDLIKYKEREHGRLNEILNSLNSKIELAKQQNNLVKEQINETLKTKEMITRYLEWYKYLNKILEDDYDTTLVKELESFAKMIVDSKIYKRDLTSMIKDYKEIISLKKERQRIQTDMI